MKLPSLAEKLENKWVALTKVKPQIVAFAKTYKALERKLKKDQKENVFLLKLPKFDQQFK